RLFAQMHRIQNRLPTPSPVAIIRRLDRSHAPMVPAIALESKRLPTPEPKAHRRGILPGFVHAARAMRPPPVRCVLGGVGVANDRENLTPLAGFRPGGQTTEIRSG